MFVDGAKSHGECDSSRGKNKLVSVYGSSKLAPRGISDAKSSSSEVACAGATSVAIATSSEDTGEAGTGTTAEATKATGRNGGKGARCLSRSEATGASSEELSAKVFFGSNFARGMSSGELGEEG